MCSFCEICYFSGLEIYQNKKMSGRDSENEGEMRRFENLSDDDSSEVDDDEIYDESDFDDPDYVPDLNAVVQNDEDEELSESGTEEEEIEDDLENPIGPNRGQKYTGQGKGDKTVWWSMPSEAEKERCEHKRQTRVQSFAYCKESFSFDDKQKSFKRLFPPSVVGVIVIETNRKAKRVYEQCRQTHPLKKLRKWQDTNVDEVYAYVAILLYSGAARTHNVRAADLFHKSELPFYRAVMSLERFQQLTRFLRFDDSRTRIARLREDKLAPIRYIWDLFKRNLTMPFIPSHEIVIDEQLLTTRNRCSFRQYIPSKPGKYGIKIFWAVDSQTNYPLAAEVYVGQQPNTARSKGIAHDLVLRLMKDYLYMGANLTVDNFFVSIPLAEDLIEKDTTMTGTIRSNKRELPKKFAAADEAKKRGPKSSVFCFSKSCELVSYTSNTNKNVLLLTTAHATEEVHEETEKPLVILDYNKHKGGVDTFDKMLRAYTCKRTSNRWPMVMFFNILDVAALGSFRLCELSDPAWKPHDKRRVFLKQLAVELAQNHLEARCKKPNLSKAIKFSMECIGFKPKNAPAVKRKMPKVQVRNRSLTLSLSIVFSPFYGFVHLIQVRNPNRRCTECKKSRQTKDNKTTAVCDLCLNPTCSMHYVRACEACYMTKFVDPGENEEGDVAEEENDEEELPDDQPGPSHPKRQRRESVINL